MIKTFIILSLFCLLSTKASDNGLLWECDSEILAAENTCIFIRTDGEIYGPHNTDLSIAGAGFRKVINLRGFDVELSGKPIEPCDVLVETDEEITGNDEAFVKAFEMMAPVFDIAMFSQDKSYWGQITKFLADCDIKSTSFLDGTPDETWYGVDDLKTLMEDPNYIDIKNEVLKFLEESQNELICIMADTGTWDVNGHCDDFREYHGLADGESSTCWEGYYDNMPTDYYSSWTFHSSVDISVCDEIIEDYENSSTIEIPDEEEIPEEETPEIPEEETPEDPEEETPEISEEETPEISEEETPEISEEETPEISEEETPEIQEEETPEISEEETSDEEETEIPDCDMPIIYEDCYFGGASQTITEDTDCIGWQPQSLCVPVGFTVQIYDLCYFGGDLVEFTTSQSCFSLGTTDLLVVDQKKQKKQNSKANKDMKAKIHIVQ